MNNPLDAPRFGQVGQRLEFTLASVQAPDGRLPLLLLEDPMRHMLEEPGEAVSALITAALAAGFTLATSVDDLKRPLTSPTGWHLAAAIRAVRMHFPEGLLILTDPKKPIAPEWLAIAQHRRRVVVVVGRLDMPIADLESCLRDSGRAGMLAAAALPFYP